MEVNKINKIFNTSTNILPFHGKRNANEIRIYFFLSCFDFRSDKSSHNSQQMQGFEKFDILHSWYVGCVERIISSIYPILCCDINEIIKIKRSNARIKVLKVKKQKLIDYYRSTSGNKSKKISQQIVQYNVE